MQRALAACVVLTFAALFPESASVSNNRSFERTAIVIADVNGEVVAFFETTLGSLNKYLAEQEETADHVEVVHQNNPRYAALREKIYKDTRYTTFIAKTPLQGTRATSFEGRWAEVKLKFGDRFFLPDEKRIPKEWRKYINKRLGELHGPPEDQ